MNTPKKFRVWLPSLNKFGDDNSVFIDCYGKLYGVTRPSLVDDSRSIVNIGQFKELDGYTIQWYTGLNDSKENPIYEGDIIEQNFGEKPTRGLVKFSRGSFRVIWPAEPYDDLGCMLIEYVTVIGNVFENPKMRGIYE